MPAGDGDTEGREGNVDGHEEPADGNPPNVARGIFVFFCHENLLFLLLMVLYKQTDCMKITKSEIKNKTR